MIQMGVFPLTLSRNLVANQKVIQNTILKISDGSLVMFLAFKGICTVDSAEVPKQLPVSLIQSWSYWEADMIYFWHN